MKVVYWIVRNNGSLAEVQFLWLESKKWTLRIYVDRNKQRKWKEAYRVQGCWLSVCQTIFCGLEFFVYLFRIICLIGNIEYWILFVFIIWCIFSNTWNILNILNILSIANINKIVYIFCQLLNEIFDLYLLNYTEYSFNLECLKFRFTALLEGICAILNLRSLNRDTKEIQSRIFIWRMLFWRNHGSAKISKK